MMVGMQRPCRWASLLCVWLLGWAYGSEAGVVGPRLRYLRHLVAEGRLSLLWSAAVLLVLALRPLWLLVPEVLPRCQLRALTGLPCPTCGTAHAAVAMLRGQLGEALAANPLMSVAALLVLGGGLLAPLWVLVARRRLADLPAPRRKRRAQ